jgi:cell division protease FtsH
MNLSIFRLCTLIAPLWAFSTRPLTTMTIDRDNFNKRLEDMAKFYNRPSSGSSADIKKDSDIPSTRFTDVAGCDYAKSEVADVVSFLRDPSPFVKLGARIPRGILLHGPPGTGKTLMARAVAGESGCKFISTTASSFCDTYIGVGPRKVREMFKQAREASPSVVFIDELDAIGGDRGLGDSASGERIATLNELLSNMDGFQPLDDVVIMGATNRYDHLDAALLRSGRFDKKIHIDYPCQVGRLQILEVHSRNKPLDNDVNLERWSRQTSGCTGADLETMMNEAALFAVKGNRQTINDRCIYQAFESLRVGRRTGRSRDAKYLHKIAIHELGHALMTLSLGLGELHSISIADMSNGMAGYCLIIPHKEKLHTQEDIIGQIMVLLGGRAAEELMLPLGEVTVGASEDLCRARALAHDMAHVYGLVNMYGGSVPEDATDVILKNCYDECQSIIRLHYSRLVTTLQCFESTETLSGKLATSMLGF